MGFFTIFQVKKVPKWVVHDVHVPVDVPVKKEVPVPVTTVKTVQAREPSWWPFRAWSWGIDEGNL